MILIIPAFPGHQRVDSHVYTYIYPLAFGKPRHRACATAQQEEGQNLFNKKADDNLKIFETPHAIQCLCCLFGASWTPFLDLLGASWGLLGASWGPLGATWAILGGYWPV